MSAPTAVSSKRRPPRLNHKKSKAGCLRCKQRRVKCDERHPVCGGCERHEVECIFPNGITSSTTIDGTAPQSYQQQPGPQIREEPYAMPSATIRHEVSPHMPQDFVSEECRGSQRLLELDLMHNFLTKTMLTLPGSDAAAVRDTWLHKAPRLALQHTALLSALLATSSFHLALLQPSGARLYVSYGQDYMALAMRQHNEGIANLNSSNADAVCLTCVLMSVLTFRNVSAYALEQSGEGEEAQGKYAGPAATLYQRMVLINGTHQTISQAWEWVKDQPDSLLGTMMANLPVLWDQRAGAARGGLYAKVQEPRLPRGLEESLKNVIEKAPRVGLAACRPDTASPSAPMVEELDDEGVKKLYELAVGHVLSLYRSIANGEYDPPSIAQLVCAASSMMPPEFMEMIEQRRPRALLIMVFCFAAIHECRDMWWIGDRGMRDVVKVMEELGCEWRLYLEWPLKYVGMCDSFILGEGGQRSRFWCDI